MYLKKLSLFLANIALIKAYTIPDNSELFEEKYYEDGVYSVEELYSDIETVVNPMVKTPEEVPVVRSPYLDLTFPLDSIPKNNKGENCDICAFNFGFIKSDPYYITYSLNYGGNYNLIQYATGEHPDGGCQNGALTPIGYGWCCDGWLPETTRKVDLLDCHGNEITLDSESHEIYNKKTGEIIPKPYIEAEEETTEEIESGTAESDVPEFVN